MTVRRFSLYRFLYLRTEFLAVLGTKLVGTFAALQCSVGMIPKRSGYIITHSSHTSQATADKITREDAKNPPIKISGKNIIR